MASFRWMTRKALPRRSGFSESRSALDQRRALKAREEKMNRAIPWIALGCWWRAAAAPSPPAEGGEGRGEEELLLRLPLSPALSPLVPREERAKLFVDCNRRFRFSQGN